MLALLDISELPKDHDNNLTELILSDYSWMEYIFNMNIPDLLNMTVKYRGITHCEATVIRNDVEYYITFSSDLFIDFLKDYLNKHNEQWDSKYTFSGEILGIQLYNTIVKNYIEIKRIS